MQRKKTFALATVLVTAVAFADDPQVYRNIEYGFHLRPPTFPVESAFGISANPVSFQSPVKDGKASVCNVQVQNMELTPTQYRELSLNQFKALGWSLDAEETRRVSGKEAVVWRYSGSGMKAIALTVYAGHRIYLVTCLAPEARFAEDEARFVTTINSFGLE